MRGQGPEDLLGREAAGVHGDIDAADGWHGRGRQSGDRYRSASFGVGEDDESAEYGGFPRSGVTGDDAQRRGTRLAGTRLRQPGGEFIERGLTADEPPGGFAWYVGAAGARHEVSADRAVIVLALFDPELCGQVQAVQALVIAGVREEGLCLRAGVEQRAVADGLPGRSLGVRFDRGGQRRGRKVDGLVTAGRRVGHGTGQQAGERAGADLLAGVGRRDQGQALVVLPSARGVGERAHARHHRLGAAMSGVAGVEEDQRLTQRSVGQDERAELRCRQGVGVPVQAVRHPQPVLGAGQVGMTGVVDDEQVRRLQARAQRAQLSTELRGRQVQTEPVSVLIAEGARQQVPDLVQGVHEALTAVLPLQPAQRTGGHQNSSAAVVFHSRRSLRRDVSHAGPP
jgi:hypothetical protein